MAETKENVAAEAEKKPAATDTTYYHHHMQKKLVVTLGALLILAAVVFGSVAAIKFFERGRLANNFRGGMMRNGEGFGQRGGRMMGGPRMLGLGQENGNILTGKVTAVNDKQFTVDVNGTAKTIQISDTTRFPVSSATKVAVNDKVVVIGEQDSNGVIQATRISVNPTFLN